MSNKSPLYAAIDLGSNSFHMLVIREVAGAVRTLAKVKRKVRLASGLDDNQLLDHASMQRGWQCLALFAEQLRDIPADNIRIVGTATLRLAKNIDQFLEKAEEILNHKVEVISGEQEAETIYLGVAATSSGQGKRLVIDIGGASTEIIVGEQNRAQLLNSLDMGCVTWLNRYFADTLLNDHNFEQATEAASQVIETYASPYLAMGWQTCIGASGTIQAIQEIFKAQGQSEVITLEKLEDLKQQAIRCKDMIKLNIKGLSSERVPVFASGLAILIALFRRLHIDSMTLAGGALREGLIYSMINPEAHEGVRQRTLQSLINRYQIDAHQAQQVKHTCEILFRQVQGNWQLDEETDFAMLQSAASLYELGLCIEFKKAPQHAAYIIDNIDLPGFTSAQQQLLSALLFNQRGKLNLSLLNKQNAVPQQKATSLVRLLRLGIILCLRRTHGSVPEVSLHADDDKLTLKLPEGWSEGHALRAAELEGEAELQTSSGFSLKITEQ